MRQEERREWRKLKTSLFHSEPSPEKTEAFVRAVMAQIPERKPSFLPQWGWWFKIPAVAFVAVFILMFTFRSEEMIPSTDTLLLGDKISEPIGSALEGRDVPAQELIGFSWEEI